MVSQSLKLSVDTLILIMIISAVIGIAVSYGDFYLFHLLLFGLLVISFIQIKNANFLLSLKTGSGNYDLFFLAMFFWYALSFYWAPNMIYAGKYMFYIFC